MLLMKQKFGKVESALSSDKKAAKKHRANLLKTTTNNLRL